MRIDKRILLIPILVLMFLNLESTVYSPITTIRSIEPNWYYGALDTANFISDLPKTSSYYLIGEDPSTRFYSGFQSGTFPNYYELNDRSGNILLGSLFDYNYSRYVDSVFFGLADNRLSASGNYTLTGFNNVDGVTAFFNLASLKNSFVFGEYYLILRTEGDYTLKISYADVNMPAQIYNINSNGWKINVFNVTLVGQTIIQLTSLLGAYINHVIVASKTYFESPNYADKLKAALEGLDIKYVIDFYGVYGVWFYNYYSLFTYIELPDASNLFNVIYASDYWRILELKP